MTEDQLQAKFWETCWNNYPHARRHMWAVPNGLKLHPLVAQLAKATGLLEGVWDLHLFWRGTLHIIETKIDKNQLTIDRVDNRGKKHFGQREWGEMMAAHGAVRHVYRTLEEGILIFESIVCKK